jgi:hypothetical protein
MKNAHRLVVDRHEEDRTIVEADGARFFELPRWLLPPATRADDVVTATVEAEEDRVVIVLVRDAGATAQAKSDAAAVVERLKRRDPGRDVQL